MSEHDVGARGRGWSNETAERNESPAPASGAGGGETASGATVLVVEAGADARVPTKMGLLADGFGVVVAVGGRNALAIARRLRPDCVLIELQLPDMSGLDVCEALRAHPDTSECTIVMLSQTEGPHQAEAFLLGADDSIVETSPDALVARLRATMRRRAAASETITVRADPALLGVLREARNRSLRRPGAELDLLSTRQLEILGRLLAGDRAPTIARDLYVSPSTIRNHLSSIFRKLGVRSQEELLKLLWSIQSAHRETLAGPQEPPELAMDVGLRSAYETADHG